MEVAVEKGGFGMYMYVNRIGDKRESSGLLIYRPFRSTRLPSCHISHHQGWSGGHSSCNWR